MKFKKLTEGIWKINTAGLEPSSNVYFLKDSMTLIDLGNASNYDILEKSLGLIGVKLDEIKNVIFTHLHYDHFGRPRMFSKAKFYCSEDELVSFRFAPFKTTLKNLEELNKVKLNKLGESFKDLEVIKTPGHTRGSVCLFHTKTGILFSGDTFYKGGSIGRTDLPTSIKKYMQDSMEKLVEYDYTIIADGHDVPSMEDKVNKEE